MSSLPNSSAWYEGSRESFLASSRASIAGQLSVRAAQENLEIGQDQSQEWDRSISLLQEQLQKRLPILRRALLSPLGESIRHVVLEYDFRRRGLRLDCVLLADGVAFVLEFKRSALSAADREQLMTYAVNLLEFHRVTRDWTEEAGGIIVPVAVLTEAECDTVPTWPGFAGPHWPALLQRPLECDRQSLAQALALGLKARRSTTALNSASWLTSPFQPSSSILDATVSLYGQHDVAAIHEHAASQRDIAASTDEIREHIDAALQAGRRRIVFLSGAPGAGKTLVGLDLVLRGRHSAASVFLTGNAPLVDVLNEALSQSYRSMAANEEAWIVTGYPRKTASLVSAAATFKIVKAHNFLGQRGSRHNQEDARVLVFDEAQRTYERGRRVLQVPLTDHEAALILAAQEEAFPAGGSVIVALVGHNQAINRGERGILAWLEAAEQRGWDIAISDTTLASAGLENESHWAHCPLRVPLHAGHLNRSLRFYRNASLEQWAGALLAGSSRQARALGSQLASEGHPVWITRDLSTARSWVRERVMGSERSGIIASGQARRLAAEGLFVDMKPDIAQWMLIPTTDIRSSNALETVQNQFQIQGLELDYCIVCWDADLRRTDESWSAYKMHGGAWKSDTLPEVAMNSYRVLLTRARKGMVVFVPRGDPTERDVTRMPKFYDDIAAFLEACGAIPVTAHDGTVSEGQVHSM